MDKGELLEQIKAILLGAAQGVVKGAREEIELAMGELAGDLTAAIAASDRAMLDLTIARIRLLGERQRIRLSATAVGVLRDVAAAVFAIAKEVILK